ncbi:MAG TPA: helix-turn-helix transcriptional regulator [Steroidobacter sp.]|uniref:helix-turn-helix domain-containing protein n=1 Tax=Steroidobacter sp. TaxID=1978227 RepID=UPI002ED86EE3
MVHHDSNIPPLALGAALRRWRLLHRVKQEHAAELLGVAQSTISRWESGRQAMEPAERAKIEAIVSARLDTSADRVLAQLVSESPRSVHLICDFTHRLLACSTVRANEFSVPASELIGSSLRRYATRRIEAEETLLIDKGWYEQAAPMPVEFDTGENDSSVVPIRSSRCRWTRLLLSDGTPARLVETLHYSRLSIQSGTSTSADSSLNRG